MMLAIELVDTANTAVMLPLAGAIAGWLIAGRAWKLAGYWCLVFCIGLSVVALSKILFLGWGVGIPSLGFKALSGHALRASAILPVLFFVLLQRAAFCWRICGVIFGMALSICIAVLLVRFRFHTTSEVVASSMLGSLVSLGFIRVAALLPVPRVDGRAAPLSLIVFIVIFSLKPAAMSHRLVDVALYLSDRDQPYAWSQK